MRKSKIVEKIKYKKAKKINSEMQFGKMIDKSRKFISLIYLRYGKTAIPVSNGGFIYCIVNPINMEPVPVKSIRIILLSVS